MSLWAVRCEGLTKVYRAGGPRYHTLRESLGRLGGGVLGRAPFGARRGRSADGAASLVRALDDASLEVRCGETFGIIGPNGAGKSTLLRILARVTRPTTGRVELRGRVGALLEVGAGFHPELTGRENIYLSGVILGMRRAEVARRFDEIVEFAEMGAFVDTPVKWYSTGMYQRLAFSVAAHLDADILLVDEGLAVGDARFQQKSTGKMQGVRAEGRTILFVSHNMLAIEALCERVALLRRGRVEATGRPREVIGRYLSHADTGTRERCWPDRASAPGNAQVRFRRVALRPDSSTYGDAITVRTGLVLEVEYWNLRPDARLGVTVHLHNESGILVFESGSSGDLALSTGLFRETCLIPGDLLNDGRYVLTALIVRDQASVVHRLDEAVVFQVEDVADLRGAYYGEWHGVVRPRLVWKNQRLELLSGARQSEGTRPIAP